MTKSSKVAILAGGRGTRLLDRSGGLPKPMVPIFGRPLLHHQIELCKRYGFLDIVLLVHHKHEVITSYFGNGKKFGVNISYSIEDVPRGTAGALYDALPLLSDQFLVLYGDTYLDVDLDRFWTFHINSRASGTLFLHPNNHPQDSDLVEVDFEAVVKAIHPYPRSPNPSMRNLVNAALYVLDRDTFAQVSSAEFCGDIARDIFPRMLRLRKKLNGYISAEYVKDMGTPDRLDKVARDIMMGIPDALSFRSKRKAIFMDRDGTINKEIGHLQKPSQVQLLDGATAAIRKINSSGLLAVVVTNQPVIARGEVSFDGLEKIHARLESLLGKGGAYLDKIYFCPHHPDKGFIGERTELKVACNCRKPKSGLIENACKDLYIDPVNSWMIGDTTSDIESGRLAGLRTILLRTGYAGSDNKLCVKADYVFPDLRASVNWVLDGYEETCQKILPIAELVALGKQRLVIFGGMARAGKSTSAQVLKEVLRSKGIQAHVISLDGWLKPKHLRGDGVLGRYDIKLATEALIPVIKSQTSMNLLEPIYDRITQSPGPFFINHKIDPPDTLILEGVPALTISEFCNMAGSIKIYVDIDNDRRLERLLIEYSWRGLSQKAVGKIIDDREFDEAPIIAQSKNIADFILNNMSANDSQ